MDLPNDAVHGLAVAAVAIHIHKPDAVFPHSHPGTVVGRNRPHSVTTLDTHLAHKLQRRPSSQSLQGFGKLSALLHPPCVWAALVKVTRKVAKSAAQAGCACVGPVLGVSPPLYRCVENGLQV